MKFLIKQIIAITLLLPCLSVFAAEGLGVVGNKIDLEKFKTFARLYNLDYVIDYDSYKKAPGWDYIVGGVGFQQPVVQRSFYTLTGRNLNFNVFLLQTKLDTGEINDLIFENRAAAVQFEEEFKKISSSSGNFYAASSYPGEGYTLTGRVIAVAYVAENAVAENAVAEDAVAKDATKSRYHLHLYYIASPPELGWTLQDSEY